MASAKCDACDVLELQLFGKYAFIGGLKTKYVIDLISPLRLLRQFVHRDPLLWNSLSLDIILTLSDVSKTKNYEAMEDLPETVGRENMSVGKRGVSFEMMIGSD